MAIGDISFYKYLEAAFRYRLFNPQGLRATLETRFNFRGYNLPFNRIFYYARRVLPSFYRTNFPDTEEGNLQMARTVLEKLDKHQDVELEKIMATPPEENIPVIEEARQESAVQPPPAATPAPVGPLPGVGIRLPSMPRLPSVTQKTSEPAGPAIKRRFNLSGFRPPASFGNAAKNFGSNLGVFFKKNVGNLFTAGRIATLVSGGIGAIVGAGLTNNHPIGIFGGAGAGTAGSFWIKSGDATKFLSRVGNGAINVGINISNQVSSGATRLSMSSGSKKWVLGLLGAFLLFFVFSAIGNLTGTTPPGQAGPLPSPGGGDISKCKFTRGGDSVKELTYKSPLLLGYIQEASTLTSIPSVVLAAFIRVETPSTVTKNDDEIRNLSSVANCPRSQTGALGVMQLQPPGTTGHDSGAITNGAKLIGKKYEELIEEDYCDVRKNIIMGAGFILKKMSYTTKDYPSYGDGTKWDPAWTNDRRAIEKLVNGYYGCLVYGGPDPLRCEGPFNYADDVSTSIQNCRAQPGIPPGIPDYKDLLDLANKIKDQFNITITNPESFTAQQLEDIYKTLAMLFQSTKFADLIRGISPSLTLDSNKPRCEGLASGKNIYLGLCNFFDGVAYVVPHELSHAIQNFSGAIYTNYIKTVAYLYDNNLIYTYPYRNIADGTLISENFAEMITNSFRGPVYRDDFTKEIFKSRYPELYQFAIQEIFGVEFN